MTTSKAKEDQKELLDAIKRHKKELGVEEPNIAFSLEQKLINAILLLPEEVVSYLLEKGANPNAMHPNGFSMMELAKALDRQAVVELLRSYGAKEISEKESPEEKSSSKPPRHP